MNLVQSLEMALIDAMGVRVQLENEVVRLRGLLEEAKVKLPDPEVTT